MHLQWAVASQKRKTSKGLLCSWSVISSSQQALNSAPLTALSLTEAIKSTLIPHSTITRRGMGGQSEHRHIKHRLCTNTLPGHKAPPQVWWGGTSPLQTNRSKWARSVRPSDFDLVLTHDVGPYVNSRACVSEGVGGLLWHYLPTAAVAVRTMSIISIQRMRLQSPQLCGHEEENKIPPPARWAREAALLQGLFSEHAFCSRWHTMLKTTGNPWTHWEGVQKRMQRHFCPRPLPLLTTLTSSNITSCEWQHDRIQKPVTFLGSVEAWGMANCVAASNRIQSINSEFHRKEKVRCLLETCIWWWCCRPRTAYIHANKYTVTHTQPSHLTRKQSVDQENINQQLFWIAINRFNRMSSGSGELCEAPLFYSKSVQDLAAFIKITMVVFLFGLVQHVAQMCMRSVTLWLLVTIIDWTQTLMHF